MNDTLTSVPGVRVGHATVPSGGSGCTVVLGSFRGVADVRGLATGTRELDALSHHHIVPFLDALVLTGGSAFGLGCADGVMAWLEERGVGFETRAARVPIVPTAVIYDLADGVDRPTPAEGRAACEAAGDGAVAQGSVGAGTGAMVGKIAGRDAASSGGIGSAAVDHGGYRVGAMVVVNAIGDVLDADGDIVAGARGSDGAFLDTSRVLRERGADGGFGALSESPPGTNTTLAVVATDAPLGGSDLERVARLASTGLARRISPVNTPFDGDIVFVLSTAPVGDQEPNPGRVMALGTAARDMVEEAIERGVRTASGREERLDVEGQGGQ